MACYLESHAIGINVGLTCGNHTCVFFSDRPAVPEILAFDLTGRVIHDSPQGFEFSQLNSLLS